MSEPGDDLQLARYLADEARKLALHFVREGFDVRQKADGSVVTDADLAVETAIREILAKERPEDAILGEEFGQTGDAPRRWVLDPIDGTHSFVERLPGWCSLIALEDEQGVAVGVCDMTPRQRRYFASRGNGSFVESDGAPARSVQANSTGRLAGARCFIPAQHWLRDDFSRSAAAALQASGRPHMPGDHPALAVATGETDVAVFFMGGPWDIAAPSIVVTEAGGRFSDLEGGSSIEQGGALYSGQAVHDEVLQLVLSHRPKLPQ